MEQQLSNLLSCVHKTLKGKRQKVGLEQRFINFRIKNKKFKTNAKVLSLKLNVNKNAKVK